MRNAFCQLPQPTPHRSATLLAALFGVLLLLGFTGCQTAPSSQFSDFREKAASVNSAASAPAEPLLLHEGDIVRVAFPGTPNLSSTAPERIRADGNITLPMIGEYKAAGKALKEVEQELLKLYEPRLVTKQVTVTVESASYPVYVTGAVLRPGKFQYDRSVTALEAVMEAGVDYNKANLKKVVVIRDENGHVQRFPLNLKGVLQGQQSQSFTLKAADIVFVPERFNWF